MTYRIVGNCCEREGCIRARYAFVHEDGEGRWLCLDHYRLVRLTA